MRRAAELLLVAGALLTTPSAHAETASESFRWRWKRFTTVEYVATSSLLLGTGAIIVFTSERPPAWQRTVFFEDPVRDAVRAETIEGRKTAAAIGDATYYAALAYPYVVEVVASAWIAHKSGDVAGQLALINTEAFALTGFLSFLSNALLRRERPYVRTCNGGTEVTFPDCTLGGKSEGFFSGHTGIAATAAGLTCAHTAFLPLYGAHGGGVAACAASLAGTFVTGYTRLVADKHYLFDVVAGAFIGFPIGYIVAWYHYKNPITAPARASWTLMPTASVSALGPSLGVSVSGVL